MKIKFLGTGAAFCLKNYNSNALVIKNDKKLLIDAGTDIRFSLYESDYSYKDIDAIYITHFHSDHIGGLEYIAFKSYFDPQCPKIKLFLHGSFVEMLWENSLKAGLSMISKGRLTLEDFFDVILVENEFQWENSLFELVRTQHVTHSEKDFPVFGLMMHYNDKVIYITGDTRYSPEFLKSNYEKADLIIHDVETIPQKSSIHPNFEELVNLDNSIKQKTLLWHYHDNVVDDFESWQKLAHKNGFKGFLKKGEILSL